MRLIFKKISYLPSGKANFSINVPYVLSSFAT